MMRGSWPIKVSFVLSFVLLGALLGASPAAAEVVDNASGRYDTVVLRNLGNHTAAVVCLVADGGAFTPQELWRSSAGAFDVSKVKFVAGDVNGDGIADGVALYDLGHARSRLYVFLSDGQSAVKRTAWTSPVGGFAWSRAKLTVGDLNRDGFDDLICLYDKGHSSASLYRFVSNGTKFTKSTGWSTRRGTFSCARAQLAAGDATGDGRDDALVLYKSTNTSSRFYVFAAGARTFTKKTFWSGAYAAGRAKLAAGDADSDGMCDLVCLYRKPDNTGRLDVFRSTGKAFQRSSWYNGAGGPLPAAACRFAAGDVTGDGRADVVIAQPTGDLTSSVTTCVSTGSAYEPHVWWAGSWPHATMRLAVAPSPGLVVADGATVLDASSMMALRAVTPDQTSLTFAGQTAQTGRLDPGDVLLAGASPSFPSGICRKVVSVTDVDGKVVVETTEAALADVIDQGEVALDKRITLADLSQKYAAPGVRLIGAQPAPGQLPLALGGPRTDGFGFNLSTKIKDNTAPGKPTIAEVKGSVWLDPSASVDWELGWTGLESASYTQTLSATTDLNVSIMKSFTKEVKATIYKQTLGVITIWVGVPVVVTPEFEVYVGANGEVQAGVTTAVKTTTDASVSISYDDDDGWDTGFTQEETVSWSPPQPYGAVTLKGFAGAGLAFKIYAVAGPEAKVEPYVKLDANTSKTPWWTLSAGIDAKLGFKVEALDITVVEETFTIPLFNYPIDWAGKGGDDGDQGPAAYEEPSIKGKIIDAGDATPVSGATVEVRSGAPPGGSAIDTAHAAADGSYIFTGLSAGQYTVASWKEGYADNNRAVTVVAGSTTTGQNVLLTAEANQGVKGKVVTSPGGGPLSGVSVGLREGGTTYWSWPDYDRYSAADGSFEFVGLEPGPYWMSALENQYFGDMVEFTVTAGNLTTGQDLHLVPYSAQGLSGKVVSTLNGLPVPGATVELHAGFDSPAGYLERTTTTAADGTYAFSGVYAAGPLFTTIGNGEYTVTAGKTGYLDSARNTTVTPATIVPDQDLDVAPVGLDNPGRSVDEDDFIRFAPGAGAADRWGDPLTEVTYEFWFKPTTGFPGCIAQTTYLYDGWPGGVTATRWTMDLGIMAENGHLFFDVNPDYSPGAPSHLLVSDTYPYEHLGEWMHIAVQCGDGGMKLMVNGQLEDSDPYTGCPQIDLSVGYPSDCWFTLGMNENSLNSPLSALGAYRELRISDVQRYSANFTPPDMAVDDLHTILLDHLVGGTTGDNNGFVWVP